MGEKNLTSVSESQRTASLAMLKQDPCTVECFQIETFNALQKRARDFDKSLTVVDNRLTSSLNSQFAYGVISYIHGDCPRLIASHDIVDASQFDYAFDARGSYLSDVDIDRNAVQSLFMWADACSGDSFLLGLETMRPCVFLSKAEASVTCDRFKDSNGFCIYSGLEAGRRCVKCVDLRS